jgi:Secretion system C-terminal sorting domain
MKKAVKILLFLIFLSIPLMTYAFTHAQYKLYSCYPNPYNPVTTIEFDLPKQGRAKIDIYNVRGQLIQTILEDYFKAGHYEIIFNANALSSGIYIYKLTASDYVSVEKMTLLK